MRNKWSMNKQVKMEGVHTINTLDEATEKRPHPHPGTFL
jgi:hypothetical protein